MRKQYKQKKGSGCALCKPHKRGWAKRWKAKDLSNENHSVTILKGLVE